MSIVQAYKRTKQYTHTFPDVTLVFEPNTVGDVVCDVQDESAVDRLLQTPTGFRLYEQAEHVAQFEPPKMPEQMLTAPPVAPRKPEKHGKKTSKVVTLPPAAVESPFVLKNGDTEFDLRPLDDAALREFAQANEIALEDEDAGDAIRVKIVDALKAEG